MIVNLTPHDIRLISGDNTVEITIPSSGQARAEQTRERISAIAVDGYVVQINKNVFGIVSGLPEPQENVFYIVSALAAKAAPGRSDLLLVDDTVRDENNRIIGCRAFARPD